MICIVHFFIYLILPEDFLLPYVDDDDDDDTGRKTDWDSSHDWSVNQVKKKMAHPDWSVNQLSFPSISCEIPRSQLHDHDFVITCTGKLAYFSH